MAIWRNGRPPWKRGWPSVFDRHGITVCPQPYVGSMLGFFFCEGPVHSFSDVSRTDTAFFARFFHGMLEEGVYLPPSAYEAWFVSHAHDDQIIRTTVDAADRVLSNIKPSRSAR
jgi:glutamate-1-semialdehyde 2,1-aminomutase